MPESSGLAAQRQRRANWVGLRTLRQHPKVVGETADGEPIYEVRSVRLLLRADGSHFHLLVPCAKCGREVAGSVVVGMGDLERPSHSVICKDCVRESDMSAYRPPEMRRPEPDPASSQTPDVTDDRLDPATSGSEPEDRRLEELEARLEATAAQVAELADVQRSESIERRRADEAVQSRLHQALLDCVSEVRADVAAASESVVSLTDDVRRNVAAMAAGLQSQRDETTRFSAALADTRQAVERLADWTGQLDRTHVELRAQVADVAAEVGGRSVPEDVGDIVDRGLQQAQTAFTAAVDERLAVLDTAQTEALAQARFQLASLEERLNGAVVTLTQMLETQRTDIEAAFDRHVPADLASLSGTVAELALDPADLRATVELVARQGADAEARMDALASTADAGSVAALEQQMQESVRRLSSLLDEQRRELRTALGLDGQPRARPADGALPGGLVDALERQLQEAEGRLAQRSVSVDDAE